jgi:hypothetical protein
MSWLKDISGEDPPAYTGDPGEAKVQDPNIPNRMVSDKPANRPFLAYVYLHRNLYLHLTNYKAIKNTAKSKRDYTTLGWRDRKNERPG